MAGFFKGLFDSLKLQDSEEAFYEHERQGLARSEKSEKNEHAERADRSERTRRAVGAETPAPKTGTAQDAPKGRMAHSASNYGTATYIENYNNGKSLRMERPDGSKIVPIKTTREGLEVCVMKPRNLEDSQDICDVLLSGCVAIVNLEDNDLQVSQRIMDFISGAVYSVNGKLFQISDLIFITAPGTVDVSGDYNDILAQTGYDVPILK